MKRMSADEAAEIIQHDQMVAFSWRYLAPLAVVQLAIVVLVKGFLK